MFRYYFVIWLATRKKGRSGNCVKCRSDQSALSVQANPRRHFTTPLDFVLRKTFCKQKKKRYIKRKVLFHVSLRGLRRLSRDDILRKRPKVTFRVLQAILSTRLGTFLRMVGEDGAWITSRFTRTKSFLTLYQTTKF